jgi:hypothetical protein
MAPLYQHYNKQKVTTPASLTVGNYTRVSNNADNAMVQNGSALRVYYAGASNPSQYANNAYWWQNVTTGPKTIVAEMSWNQINHGGWIGLGFRSSSNGSTASMFHISYGGYGWRWIAFNAPPGSYYSGPSDTTISLSVGQHFWLKIVDDGTNMIFSRSTDGVNFSQQISTNRSLLPSVDQWCISLVPSIQGGNVTDANVHNVTIT